MRAHGETQPRGPGSIYPRHVFSAAVFVISGEHGGEVLRADLHGWLTHMTLELGRESHRTSSRSLGFAPTMSGRDTHANVCSTHARRWE